MKRAWPGAVEVPAWTRRPRAILGDVEPKGSSRHFTAVHLLDGFGGLLFICEANEGKAAWAPGLAVGWDVNVHDFANFGEQLSELSIGDREVEITYEYLV